MIALASAWLVQRQAESRRVRQIAADLVPFAEDGRFDELYARVVAEGLDLNDPRADALAAAATGSLMVSVDPPSATVTTTRVAPIDGFPSRRPVPLGVSGASERLVAGQYLISASDGDAAPLTFLVEVDVGDEIVVSRSLVSPADGLGDMVLVGEGPSPLGGQVIPAFLIDKHEVTNAEYLEYVTAGGYRDPVQWSEALLVAGDLRPWDEAMRTFVDRTGLAGPRGWSQGEYPAGSADHPVVGISWYEATAYARWKGKQLPDPQQWWRAAIGDGSEPFPWGSDVRTFDLRANFGLVGTTPVGAYPLGVSPFGGLDMAGNAREWLAVSNGGERRPVSGGSWQDPTYMFDPQAQENFGPDYSNDAIGFRLVMAPRIGQ